MELHSPDDEGFLFYPPLIMDDKPKLTEKPGYFAIIPAVVRYDKKLSAISKLLYGEITCLLNFKNKCFASNAYFARLYDCSERTISRYVKELLDGEYIEIKMEKKGSGTERFLTLRHDKSVASPHDKSVASPHDKSVYHNKQISINIISLSKDKENVLFIEFWKLFPNHKGLKEAFKSWSKLSKQTHELIIEKLPSWLIGNGDLFVPMPATWLNQERWNDEFLLVPLVAKQKETVPPPVPVYVPIAKSTNDQHLDPAYAKNQMR